MCVCVRVRIYTCMTHIHTDVYEICKYIYKTTFFLQIKCNTFNILKYHYCRPPQGYNPYAFTLSLTLSFTHSLLSYTMYSLFLFFLHVSHTAQLRILMLIVDMVLHLLYLYLLLHLSLPLPSFSSLLLSSCPSPPFPFSSSFPFSHFPTPSFFCFVLSSILPLLSPLQNSPSFFSSFSSSRLSPPSFPSFPLSKRTPKQSQERSSRALNSDPNRR